MRDRDADEPGPHVLHDNGIGAAGAVAAADRPPSRELISPGAGRASRAADRKSLAGSGAADGVPEGGAAVAPNRGKNAPHFDIAQLFIKRARQLYFADPDHDPAAWIVKKSALRAGGWAKFREWHEPILTQSLGLEAVQPFGGGDARRCCVLFERRPSASLAPGIRTRALRRYCPNGRPDPGSPPEQARDRIIFEDAPAPLPRQAPDVAREDEEPPESAECQVESWESFVLGWNRAGY